MTHKQKGNERENNIPSYCFRPYSRTMKKTSEQGMLTDIAGPGQDWADLTQGHT